MATEHPDVAAELWSLAETVFTRLEPLMRQAAEDQEGRPQQGCSWCPVCAFAALVRGEQHDLLTLLTSEGATLIALLRQIVAEHAETSTTRSASSGPTPPAASREHADGSGSGGDADDTEEPTIRRAAFQPITVTVKDSTRSDQRD